MIPAYALRECSNLEKVTLPETVTTLPDFVSLLHASQPKPAIWNGSSYDVVDDF